MEAVTETVDGSPMHSWYERLSKLDESFLTFETPNTGMHVALTGIFETGTLAARDGGIDVDRIRRHIGSRLHVIPRFRQRLVHAPVIKDAVWVDDARFDLDYHVRHTSLPHPGNDEQLRARCAEILERPLSRKRPLWESWIVEGLADRRFALLIKVHHCMADGVGGLSLLAALFDVVPRDETDEIQPWHPRPEPTDGELLRDEALRRGRRLLGLGRDLRAALREPRRSGSAAAKGVAALWSVMSTSAQPTPSLPFNGSVGPYRRVGWLAKNLDVIRAVRRRLGCTVNDVILATVGGGLLRYLRRRRSGERTPRIKIAIPINMRAADEGSGLGNHVSLMMLSLPVDVADPWRRLQVVSETTAELKRKGQRDGVDLLTQAAEWASGNVLSVAVRLISSASPYNLIVTNVPGPPLTFYLLGARLVEAYPYLPLFENQGLGVAIFSYAGRVYWGLTGDWELMADLDDLAADISDAFDELCDTAGAGHPTHASVNGAAATLEL